MAAVRYASLLRELPLPPSEDAAHDSRHLRRVTETAVRLAEASGAALDVVVPAAWLHDLVQYPKTDPRNVGSSRESADAAIAKLRAIDYEARRHEWFEAPSADGDVYARIHHAVAAHSFSAGIPPESLEAEVVRDADRLDAIGAIGIARMFAVGGALARPLYHEADPFAATHRALDDKTYTVDHFYNKLFKLTYCTPAADAEAARRFASMRAFLAELQYELGEPAGIAADSRDAGAPR